MPFRAVGTAFSLEWVPVPLPFGLPTPPANHPQLPAGLSLCMIVRDEERFLADALASVSGAVDEMIVVDTGSSDATIVIAERAGARVERIAWRDNFSHARNAALALARFRWIFVLDADERLAPGSREALRLLRETPAAQTGCWIACRNLTDEVRGSGVMTNALIRIFPNDPRIRYRNAVHEFPALDGSAEGLTAVRTPIEITHHGYLSDVMMERAKAERNLRLAKAEAARDPDDPFHSYNLGMAALLAGERVAALRALEAMVAQTQAQPRGFRPHGMIVLADAYIEDGQLGRARTLVDTCLAAVPTFANAHFSSGKIFAAQARYFDARAAFADAIAAGEHNAEHFVVDDEVSTWKAHSEIGATLLREARYADALAWFDLGLENRAAAEPLLTNRAKALEGLGRDSEADEAYRAAFAAAKSERTAIEYVNVLLRRGNDPAALAAIRDTLPVLSPGYQVVFLATAGAIVARLEDAAGAARFIAAALDVLPERAEAVATIAALARQFDDPPFSALVDAALADEPSVIPVNGVFPSDGLH